MRGKIVQNDVNIQNLSIGMVVKNYKQMCELLQETITTGMAKKAQIKNWKRYFDFDREGQKFIINEIFDTPYPTYDARKQRDSIYVKYIELLLMEYLSKQEGQTASFTKKNLYQLLGMVSPKYYNYRYNTGIQYDNLKNDLSTIQVEKSDINEFYQRADAKLNSILSSALKSMANRFLIKYQTEYIICKSVDDGKGNYVNTFVSATNLETSWILAAEREVMLEMGYQNKSEMLFKGVMGEFFKNLDKFIAEYKSDDNWHYVYSHIKIIHLRDEIKKQIPIQADEIKKLSADEKKFQLNQAVANSLMQQIDKKRERELECVNLIFGSENDMVYSREFIAIQQELINYLIKINNSEIDNYKKEKENNK